MGCMGFFFYILFICFILQSTVVLGTYRSGCLLLPTVIALLTYYMLH